MNDFYLTSLSRDFEDGANQLNTDVMDALGELQDNPSDPALLAAYQAALSDYTLFRNAQSNTVKSMKDIAASIVANFR